jgi:hypothetical protein
MIASPLLSEINPADKKEILNRDINELDCIREVLTTPREIDFAVLLVRRCSQCSIQPPLRL